MTTPIAFADSPIGLGSLDAARFSSDGLEIADPMGLLAELGYAEAVAHTPTIVHDGVQTAARGVIQDPAGSAVGAGCEPTPSIAGGASGAIYATFTDLAPIPPIPPGAAIFNASSGAGKRVLHTHSPVLGGSPAHPADRADALQDIANAYFNAITAFDRQAALLGNDPGPLNLVPISAGIFGGAFRNPKYPAPGHLDPSYSITAILTAVGESAKQRRTIPALTLYCFGAAVFDDARRLAAALRGS